MEIIKKRFEFPSRGIAIETKSTHNNIFMIRDINDKSEHGNLGLYSIAWYDSAVSLRHYYHIELHDITQNTNDEWIKDKWRTFCGLRGIKKWKNSSWRTTIFPKKNCELSDFLIWLST